MLKSAVVRVRELSRVFQPLSASNFEAIIARLGPLYEDMRIELYGIATESLAELDQLDARYRRMYFLRKSIGTLREFAEAIGQLERCPEFGLISSEFTPELWNYWRKASRYFKQAEPTLRLVRNDVAGHFGLEAARYATQNFDPDAVEGIEMTEPRTDHGRFLLQFAGPMVATAMVRHARGLDRAKYITHLIKNVRVGYQHATRCVHSVVVCYLWNKLG
jgi:hypothetical protein